MRALYGLLDLFVFIFFSIKTNAQLIDGNTYYIQNVETGTWLGPANSWGTQASLNYYADGWVLNEIENNIYTLEGVAANGDWCFFNGTYCDGAKTKLTISLVEGSSNAYTIYTEGYVHNTNISGISQRLIVDNSGTNPFEKSAQWIFYSEMDFKKMMLTASEDNPIEASWLLFDKGFDRHNRNSDVWEKMRYDNSGYCYSCSVSTGNDDFCVAESYFASDGFNVYQTVNVPNGTYILNAQATYYSPNQIDSNVPEVYANDVSSCFIPITEKGFTIPQVGQDFSKGMYKVLPIIVTVENKTLTIGFRCSRSDVWAIWDNIELKCIYCASVNSFAQEDLREALLYTKDYSETDANIYVKQAYSEAVIEASLAVNIDGKEEEFYLNVLNQMNAARQSVEESIELYKEIVKINEKAAILYGEESSAAYVDVLETYKNKTADELTPFVEAYKKAKELATGYTNIFIDIIESTGNINTGWYGASNLFDNNPNTSWMSFLYNDNERILDQPYYIIFSPQQRLSIKSYTLIDSNDTFNYWDEKNGEIPGHYNRKWTSWAIYGSNDPFISTEMSWSKIHNVEISNSNFNGTNPQDGINGPYFTKSTGAYKYYKIEITSLPGYEYLYYLNGLDSPDDYKYCFIQQMADMNIIWDDGKICESHVFSDNEFKSAIPATCEKPGMISYYECEMCGNRYLDINGRNEVDELYTPALGHKFDPDGNCIHDGCGSHVNIVGTLAWDKINIVNIPFHNHLSSSNVLAYPLYRLNPGRDGFLNVVINDESNTSHFGLFDINYNFIISASSNGGQYVKAGETYYLAPYNNSNMAVDFKDIPLKISLHDAFGKLSIGSKVIDVAASEPYEVIENRRDIYDNIPKEYHYIVETISSFNEKSEKVKISIEDEENNIKDVRITLNNFSHVEDVDPYTPVISAATNNPVQIILVGINSIKAKCSDRSGIIDSYSELSIKGDGMLNIEVIEPSGECVSGITLFNNNERNKLSIENCEINITESNCLDFKGISSYGDLLIKDATLNINSGGERSCGIFTAYGNTDIINSELKVKAAKAFSTSWDDDNSTNLSPISNNFHIVVEAGNNENDFIKYGIENFYLISHNPYLHIYSELKDEVVVEINEQEIVLTKTQNGEYSSNQVVTIIDGASLTSPVDFIAPSVNYTRDLSALTGSDWGTLCVPFELPFDAAEGVTFYTLTSATAEAITLSPVTSGSLPAGTPVLFKRGAETSSLRISINSSTQVKHSTATGSASSGLTLTGTYVPTEIADGYYLATDGVVYSAAEYATEHPGSKVQIGAFHAWFAGSLASSAKGLILNVDDDATALEAIDALTSGKAEYYDMQGRKLNEMQRGINIVRFGNGKTMKVNIK